MANDLTGPTWVIDTASATLLYAKLIHCRGIRWVSKSATSGDDVEIQDAEGHVVWKSVANAANYVEADTLTRSIYGLQVPVLDSGELFLEIA